MPRFSSHLYLSISILLHKLLNLLVFSSRHQKLLNFLLNRHIFGCISNLQGVLTFQDPRMLGALVEGCEGGLFCLFLFDQDLEVRATTQRLDRNNCVLTGLVCTYVRLRVLLLVSGLGVSLRAIIAQQIRGKPECCYWLEDRGNLEYCKWIVDRG